MSKAFHITTDGKKGAALKAAQLQFQQLLHNGGGISSTTSSDHCDHGTSQDEHSVSLQEETATKTTSVSKNEEVETMMMAKNRGVAPPTGSMKGNDDDDDDCKAQTRLELLNHLSQEVLSIVYPVLKSIPIVDLTALQQTKKTEKKQQKEEEAFLGVPLRCREGDTAGFTHFTALSYTEKTVKEQRQSVPSDPKEIRRHHQTDSKKNDNKKTSGRRKNDVVDSIEEVVNDKKREENKNDNKTRQHIMIPNQIQIEYIALLIENVFGGPMLPFVCNLLVFCHEVAHCLSPPCCIVEEEVNASIHNPQQEEEGGKKEIWKDGESHDAAFWDKFAEVFFVFVAIGVIAPIGGMSLQSSAASPQDFVSSQEAEDEEQQSKEDEIGKEDHLQRKNKNNIQKGIQQQKKQKKERASSLSSASAALQHFPPIFHEWRRSMGIGKIHHKRNQEESSEEDNGGRHKKLNGDGFDLHKYRELVHWLDRAGESIVKQALVSPFSL